MSNDIVYAADYADIVLIAFLNQTLVLQKVSIKSPFSTQCNLVYFYIDTEMDFWWALFVLITLSPTFDVSSCTVRRYTKNVS